MRTGKLLIVAMVLLAAPRIAFATHVPGSSEKVQYDSTLTPDVAVTGTIGWSAPIDGYDWYCFNATTGQKVTLTAKRSAGDLKLNVGIMSGISDDETQTGLKIVADTSNSTDPDVVLTYTPDFTGPATVFVSTFLDEKQGSYSLTMSGGSARSACSSKAPVVPTNPIAVSVPGDERFMGNSDTITVPVSVTPTDASAVNLSVVGLPDDVITTFEPSTFPSPGSGTATLTIKTSATTLPNTYTVTVVATNAANEFETGGSTFLLTIECTPPMILGIDQPRDTTFASGSSATITTKSVGSGPLSYQWYRGPRGSTSFPVAGATGATLTTSNEGMYWVRVSNACGTYDSNAVFATAR